MQDADQRTAGRQPSPPGCWAAADSVCVSGPGPTSTHFCAVSVTHGSDNPLQAPESGPVELPQIEHQDGAARRSGLGTSTPPAGGAGVSSPASRLAGRPPRRPIGASGRRRPAAAYPWPPVSDRGMATPTRQPRSRGRLWRVGWGTSQLTAGLRHADSCYGGHGGLCPVGIGQFSVASPGRPAGCWACSRSRPARSRIASRTSAIDSPQP
jgi:hypothetical protein